MADRKATKSESRAMWRVVQRALDQSEPAMQRSCVHHRGRVSTVKSRRFKFGKVTVADRHCGNGEFVLRRTKQRGRWHIRGAGSDWGSPDRCKDDLAHIPRKVLEDLFYPGICR